MSQLSFSNLHKPGKEKKTKKCLRVQDRSDERVFRLTGRRLKIPFLCGSLNFGGRVGFHLTSPIPG